MWWEMFRPAIIGGLLGSTFGAIIVYAITVSVRGLTAQLPGSIDPEDYHFGAP